MKSESKLILASILLLFAVTAAVYVSAVSDSRENVATNISGNSQVAQVGGPSTTDPFQDFKGLNVTLGWDRSPQDPVIDPVTPPIYTALTYRIYQFVNSYDDSGNVDGTLVATYDTPCCQVTIPASRGPNTFAVTAVGHLPDNTELESPYSDTVTYTPPNAPWTYQIQGKNYVLSTVFNKNDSKILNGIKIQWSNDLVDWNDLSPQPKPDVHDLPGNPNYIVVTYKLPFKNVPGVSVFFNFVINVKEIKP